MKGALSVAPAWLTQAVVRKPAPVASPRPAPRPTMDMVPYATAAIDAELKAVEHAKDGVRNDTLNRAAFAIAGFVRAGLAPERWARDHLYSRAVGAGLLPREALSTIESAFRAAQPRCVPQRRT